MAALQKPIVLSTLATMLGTRKDVGAVCTSDSINKWALYKPVRSSKIAALTKDDMKGAHCGLSPVTLARLKTMDIIEATGSYTKEQVLAEVSSWLYARPRGKATYEHGDEWYRLLDFDGYEPNALPSDTNWDDRTISRQQLLDARAATATIEYAESTKPASACLSPSYSLIIGNGAMRFGEASPDVIGGLGTLHLPIAYITGEGVLNDYWRIGYAVCIPYNSGYRWGLVVGRNPISLARNASSHYIEPQLALPDLMTNQAVVDNLISATPSTGSAITKFPCIPVLVKNAYFKGHQSASRYRVSVDADDAFIYCMPSGYPSFFLNVSTSGLPDIPGANVYSSLGSDWYICTYSTGQYTPFGTSISQLAILRAQHTTGTARFTGKITFSYGAGDGHTYTTETSVEGSRTAETITINGHTFYGFAVATYPAIQITNSTVTIL